MITREDVELLLRYEKETGQFYWRVTNSNRAVVGTLAGTVDCNGRIIIKINRKSYLAHQLVWLITHHVWPPDEIDHKNGDAGDNRIDNLRIATHAENMRNSRKRSNNTSGFKGVDWRRDKGKWRAKIQVDSKSLHIGYFPTAEDAHAAYCSAAEKHHGKFARFS
jgi:hypothetical protein